MKAKTRSPKDAKTFNQVCELERDIIFILNSWMSVDGRGVRIYNQKPGHAITGCIDLSRDQFLKLYEWYVKPQKIEKQC